MTVNKVILIGNLGADPDTKNANGTEIANLRIATSHGVKDRDGNWRDETEWHRVVCFGKTAENVGRYLSKGRQVYVEGRLRTQKWQDRDGNDRWTTEVVASQVRFLGSKDGGGGGGGGGGRDDRGGNGGRGRDDRGRDRGRDDRGRDDRGGNGGGGGNYGGGGGGGGGNYGGGGQSDDSDIPF